MSVSRSHTLGTQDVAADRSTDRGADVAAGDTHALLLELDHTGGAIDVRQLRIPNPGKSVLEGNGFPGAIPDQLAELVAHFVGPVLNAAAEDKPHETHRLPARERQVRLQSPFLVGFQRSAGEGFKAPFGAAGGARNLDLSKEGHVGRGHFRYLRYGKTVKGCQRRQFIDQLELTLWSGTGEASREAWCARRTSQKPDGATVPFPHR